MLQAGCPEIASRTDIATISSPDGEPVWCYMLDSSHDMHLLHGACNTFYTTQLNYPGMVRLCYIANNGVCKSSARIWCNSSLSPTRHTRRLRDAPLVSTT